MNWLDTIATASLLLAFWRWHRKRIVSIEDFVRWWEIELADGTIYVRDKKPGFRWISLYGGRQVKPGSYLELRLTWALQDHLAANRKQEIKPEDVT